MLKDTSIYCLEAKCSQEDFLWTTARSLGTLFTAACPTESVEKVFMIDDLFVQTADLLLVLKSASQILFVVLVKEKHTISC